MKSSNAFDLHLARYGRKTFFSTHKRKIIAVSLATALVGYTIAQADVNSQSDVSLNDSEQEQQAARANARNGFGILTESKSLIVRNDSTTGAQYVDVHNVFLLVELINKTASEYGTRTLTTESEHDILKHMQNHNLSPDTVDLQFKLNVAHLIDVVNSVYFTNQFMNLKNVVALLAQPDIFENDYLSHKQSVFIDQLEQSLVNEHPNAVFEVALLVLTLEKAIGSKQNNVYIEKEL